MSTINLTAKGRDQELILAYLQQNASDVLAEKINNGTPFEKDGKQLINRKDLDGFMSFACDEARKLAEKGSRSAAVEDSVVYGWATHYFEEDSIVGKLFNSDGTEYKPPAQSRKVKTKVTPKPTPPPKPKSQFSFFDMLNNKKDEQPSTDATEQKSNVELHADDNEVVDNAEQPVKSKAAEQKQSPQIVESTPQPTVEQKPKNPLYEKYKTYTDRYPDSVITMRVGDFYEVFGKKATLIADKANLTLTGRDMGFEQRIPMVGFPIHAAEAYFKKIRQSYPLVIVDGDNVQKLNIFGIEDVLDGDDDLTEEEMRLFDGDITEPKDIPDTPSKEQPKIACEPSTDSDSPYDEIALAKVVKILGDTFILR